MTVHTTRCLLPGIAIINGAGTSGLGQRKTIQMNKNNEASPKSSENVSNPHDPTEVYGRLLAKVVTQPEYWECHLPEGSRSCAYMRSLALDTVRTLKNPKSTKDVVTFLNSRLMTQVAPWPRQLRAEIAKSFLAALDLERIEALVHERLGI